MDIKTIGTRHTVGYQLCYARDADARERTGLTLQNRRIESDTRQAVMNDEEAAWLLKNYPDLEWKEHSEGGLAVILDGLRYRVTKEQKAAHDGSKRATKVSVPKTEEEYMTREEVVRIAKMYGLKTNKKTEVLLKLIKIAEKNEKSKAK